MSKLFHPAAAAGLARTTRKKFIAKWLPVFTRFGGGGFFQPSSTWLYRRRRCHHQPPAFPSRPPRSPSTAASATTRCWCNGAEPERPNCRESFCIIKQPVLPPPTLPSTANPHKLSLAPAPRPGAAPQPYLHPTFRRLSFSPRFYTFPFLAALLCLVPFTIHRLHLFSAPLFLAFHRAPASNAGRKSIGYIRVHLCAHGGDGIVKKREKRRFAAARGRESKKRRHLGGIECPRVRAAR